MPLKSAVRSALGLATFHLYHVLVSASRGHGLAATRGKLAGIKYALSRSPSAAEIQHKPVGERVPFEDPLRPRVKFRVITE